MFYSLFVSCSYQEILESVASISRINQLFTYVNMTVTWCLRHEWNN